MKEETEELAIIKDIHIGVRDIGKCICWFTVDILSGGALQVITVDEICNEMNRCSIYKLEDLNGKPCIVSRNGNLIKFKKLHI